DAAPPPRDRASTPRRCGSPFRHEHSLGQLRRRPGPWKLEECERIAASLRDDPIADDGIRWSGYHRIDEHAGFGRAEPRQLQHGDPCEIAFVGEVARGVYEALIR